MRQLDESVPDGDKVNELNHISSWDCCQRFSLLQTYGTLRAGSETSQDLSLD